MRVSVVRSALTRIFSSAACTAVLIAVYGADGTALTFKKAGAFIEVSGKFEPGDAARFRDFMSKFPPPDVDNEISVSLNSPGGNLAEGIEFGLFVHQAGLATIVTNGNQCHSACAIAFLGGIARGVAASGFGRRLQIGAKLGFHGFSTPEPSKVVVLKHAFDAARVINAVIVQYANELGGVDLALLSELISIDPTNIRTVATPRELRGLSIDVVGSLPPRPADWALNACTRAVEAHRPIRDMPLAERISASSERMRIGTIGGLRQALLADRFPVDGERNRETQAALARLSSDEFFRVVAGLYQPTLPIERIRLDRGAGFYFDRCYAIAGYSGPQTLLIDGVGGQIVDTHHGKLGWYADGLRLW